MKNNRLSSMLQFTPCCLLGLGLLLGGISARAVPPPPPSNLQARVTPAEILFTWDASPGAAYYKIYRGGPDRRWFPLPQHLTVPRFRDTDFTGLPGYYQIGAFNAAGEGYVTEILVTNATSDVDLYAHLVRQVSDSAATISWITVGAFADALLEVGTGTNDAFFFAFDGNHAQQHEFLVTNLAPNVTYWFRLTSTAANRAGITYRNTFTTEDYVSPSETPVSILPPPGSILQVDEDSILPLLLTADNPGGSELQFSVLSLPTRGKLSGVPPHLVYTPNIASGFGVYDAFICSVTDGQNTFSAQVLLTIRPGNHQPYSRDGSALATEDLAAVVPFKGTDLEGSPIQYVIIHPPTNGILLPKSIYEPGVLLYWPNTNFHGVDHVAYAAVDAVSTGNVASVRLVTLPVNDPPSASNYSLSIIAGTPLSFALGVSDPDGDRLSATIIQSPRYGIAVVSLDGQASYSTRANITNSSDMFKYTVTDGQLTATGTVSIAILFPGPPAAPSGLVGNSTSSGQIDLHWLDNSWNEDRFEIERSNDNKSWKVIGSQGPNLSSYLDAGLTGNKIFSYRVRAINSLGISAYSNPVSLKALK